MATVLLIGERSQVLDELAEIVEGDSHFVVRANNFSDLDNMDMTHTDVVTFGRTLTEAQITELQAKYRQKNPRIIFVRGLAPIPSLLAIQINAALTPDTTGPQPSFDRRNHAVQIVLSHQQPVRVTVWWLSLFYHPKMKVVLEKVLTPGTHTVAMPTWAADAKRHVTVEIGKRDAFVV